MTINHEAFATLLETARQLRRKRRERVARLLGLKLPAAGLPPVDIDVRTIRKVTGLTQRQFAEVLGIELATLRNWEQGRRQPTGPARALLRAIKNDPIGVLKALAG